MFISVLLQLHAKIASFDARSAFKLCMVSPGGTVIQQGRRAEMGLNPKP